MKPTGKRKPRVASKLTTQQLNRLAQIEQSTPSYLGITKKAYTGTSKAAGIKAKCLDCTCWQRSEIENCTVSACPLWPYRPYQQKNTAKNSEISGSVG